MGMGNNGLICGGEFIHGGLTGKGIWNTILSHLEEIYRCRDQTQYITEQFSHHTLKPLLTHSHTHFWMCSSTKEQIPNLNVPNSALWVGILLIMTKHATNTRPELVPCMRDLPHAHISCQQGNLRLSGTNSCKIIISVIQNSSGIATSYFYGQ